MEILHVIQREVAGLKTDPAALKAYLERLKADPKGTLRTAGLELPEHHEVKVMEDTDAVTHRVTTKESGESADSENQGSVRVLRNTENTTHIVVRQSGFVSGAELDDDELSKIAG